MVAYVNPANNMEHKGIALKEYQDFLDDVKPAHNLPIPWWKSYRIVDTGYNSFEVQEKYIWWPFWIDLGYSNSRPTIAECELLIIRDLKPSVKVYKHLG